MITTMFKLVAGDGGVINTAEFDKFDSNPEKGRRLARAHIEYCRERWGHHFPADEDLQIVEA